MEPININVSVEVNLSQNTQNFLSALLGSAKTEARRASAPAVETKQAPAPAKAEPKKNAAPESTPAKPANDTTKEITDEQLRQAVKAAKDATSAADVRALFAKFGIKTSIECPQDKRRQLVDELMKLAA